MKINAVQKMKTGGMVIGCLALLIILIYLVGKQQKIFGKTFSVYTHFKNVAGAREGNFVRYAGINIGTVSSIGFINDTTVRLSLDLDKSVQRHLKNNAIATIGSDGLMGDKLIILHANTDSSATAIKEGEILPSVDPVDVDKIMNNLSRISVHAETITAGLSDLVGKINNGEGAIGRMVGDEKMADKLEGTVTTINKAAANVNENMEAAKSNFLLRGYFKKKERKRIKDSIENAQKNINVKKKEEE